MYRILVSLSSRIPYLLSSYGAAFEMDVWVENSKCSWFPAVIPTRGIESFGKFYGRHGGADVLE